MDYWHKQTIDKPLFPELLWSRPENRLHAGKLAIIGGNLHGFSAPAEAYNLAMKAGIGTAKVLLPSSIEKIVGPVLEHGEFAPSNPSGSFSQKALATFLDLAAWADGTLLAGDLGRNSETAIALEKFLTKHQGQVTLTKDAADYFIATARTLGQRPNTCLVLSFAQLQKLGSSLGFSQPFTFSMDLLNLVRALHELTTDYPLNIITKHQQNLLVATAGQVSTTKLPQDPEIWRLKTAAYTSVWWLQNPSQTFQALTTAITEVEY